MIYSNIKIYYKCQSVKCQEHKITADANSTRKESQNSIYSMYNFILYITCNDSQDKKQPYIDML